MVKCLSSMIKDLVLYPVPEIKIKQKLAGTNKILSISVFKIM